MFYNVNIGNKTFYNTLGSFTTHMQGGKRFHNTLSSFTIHIQGSKRFYNTLNSFTTPYIVLQHPT